MGGLGLGNLRYFFARKICMIGSVSADLNMCLRSLTLPQPYPESIALVTLSFSRRIRMSVALLMLNTKQISS
jgi:hypothetical protein